MSAVTLDQQLQKWMKTAYREAYPEDLPADFEPEIVPAANPQFGDYQCNDAMRLARLLKTAPVKIAAAVVDAAPDIDLVESVETAGPGFINIRCSDAALARLAEAQAADDRLGVPAVGEGKTVVLDYSSPNVAKPMHIGHIRSTVIGNALDRLHRFCGYRVVADNHLGDWGTQFGLLIMGYRHFIDEKALNERPAEELERVYVKSYECSKEDPEWLEQAREELVKLQNGNPENQALWKRFVDLSLKEFEHIYNRLDVSFDLVRGESYYHDDLPKVVEALQQAGLAVESEGAQVVFLEDEGLGVCIVRKKDGAFNYATSDLATVRSRMAEFQPETIIYVTDERQQRHFSQVFTICRKMGWAENLQHVWFGLMRLPEATFSTRQGNVIKLERLLDEAEERALALVRESSPDMPEDQQQDVARAIGIGAVKYADLSQNPQSLVTFTWEKALSMEGHSAPYLQYAVARIASVRDKYKASHPDRTPESCPIRVTEAIEHRLIVRCLQFPNAVQRACEQYKPSALCEYLYDLAQLYSSFYQQVPFLKAEEGARESRVRLCGLTASVLRKGLNLLGITTPERI